MERRAAKISFSGTAVVFLLAAFQACAPAVNPQAQISFTMKGYKARGSALAYDSTTFDLADDMCYAIHVTSQDNHPAIQRVAPTPSELACENGPRGLGMLAGTFAKGAVAELDVPVGPKRRFDLVGIPKALVPGGQCGPGLRAEVTPRPAGSTAEGPQVNLFIGTTALPKDDESRLIARGEADINPGVVDVVLEAVAVDPHGVEYTCNPHGSGSGSGSGAVATGPGSISDPLPRPGPYLQMFLPADSYISSANISTFSVDGSCSEIGSYVFANIAGVTRSFHCVDDSTPRPGPNGVYFKEGRWGSARESTPMYFDFSTGVNDGDDLTLSVTQTVNGNPYSLQNYIDNNPNDTNAYIPVIHKDTVGPTELTANSPSHVGYSHTEFTGQCAGGKPIFVTTCTLGTGYCAALVTPPIGCTGTVGSTGTFSATVLHASDYELTGTVEFTQYDDLGNAASVHPPGF